MMNKIFILISAFNFFLSNQGIALITKSKGDVEYFKNDGTVAENKLKKGTSLFDQDRITTGANGFAKYVYLDDGSVIKVHKNAEVYVLGAVDNRAIIKQVRVTDGNVKFEVSKQGSNEFTVVTPTSVATVKGTDFWLESDEDEGDSDDDDEDDDEYRVSGTTLNIYNGMTGRYMVCHYDAERAILDKSVNTIHSHWSRWTARIRRSAEERRQKEQLDSELDEYMTSEWPPLEPYCATKIQSVWRGYRLRDFLRICRAHPHISRPTAREAVISAHNFYHGLFGPPMRL